MVNKVKVKPIRWEKINDFKFQRSREDIAEDDSFLVRYAQNKRSRCICLHTDVLMPLVSLYCYVSPAPSVKHFCDLQATYPFPATLAG